MAREADAETHYEVLGVRSDASRDDIVAAYRRLAHEFHPDKNQQATPGTRKLAEEQFKRVQAAYETLRDSMRRKAYDAELRSADDEARKRTELEEVRGAFDRGELDRGISLAKALSRKFVHDGHLRDLLAEIAAAQAVTRFDAGDLDNAVALLQFAVENAFSADLKEHLRADLNLAERTRRESFRAKATPPAESPPDSEESWAPRSDHSSDASGRRSSVVDELAAAVGRKARASVERALHRVRQGLALLGAITIAILVFRMYLSSARAPRPNSPSKVAVPPSPSSVKQVAPRTGGVAYGSVVPERSNAKAQEEFEKGLRAQIDGNGPAAALAYQAAIDADSGLALAVVALWTQPGGEAYVPRSAQKQVERALAELQEYSSVNADSRVWRAIASARRFLGDWAGAEAALRAAIKTDPDDGFAYDYLRGIMLARGRETEAAAELGKEINAFQRWVVKHPNDGLAYFRLGQALFDAGDDQQALAALQRAATLCPTSDIIQHSVWSAENPPARPTARGRHWSGNLG